MHNLAEFILCCAMPRENAAAAAGDLEEMSPGRVFWASVRLALSTSFRNLYKAPLQFLWIAFYMWLLFLWTWFVYSILAWASWLALYVADHHTALELVANVPVSPPKILSMLAALVVVPAIGAWQMGGEVLRKSPAPPLPLCFTIAIVWTSAGFLTKTPMTTVFVTLACALAGMLRARWNEVRSATR